ncbi:polysaccharide pyruvyl transferase family protein [Psychroserpens mesophilus]|uniref:polysaccharide pyruvyl transferase family protein n=1 Tax=Psychroserpens mesophilus TaxID=325473 RepID=UPI003D64E81E
MNIPFIESHYARVHNFGDLFSSDLLNFLGYKLVYVDDYKKSSMSLTGSILQMYHQDFSGFVMGSGFIHERFNRSGSNWKVKIIRGPLSKAQCGYTEKCLFGDPGILASVVFPKRVNKKYRLGILPHCVDYEDVKKLNFEGQVKIISARQSAKDVALEIQECDYIASSSLHGLIFADSYGIPNIHIRFGDKLIGGNHKFKDYYLGMDSNHEFISYSNQSVNDIVAQCKLRFNASYVQKKQNEMLSVYKNVLSKL